MSVSLGRLPIETKGETDKDALLRVEHLSSKTEDIRILQDVSTLSFSNQVQAILGPTGAGKSSLLSFIAGRKLHADCTGVVLVDGEPRSRPWLCKNVAFLEQDEALLPTATVRETLEFAARLRHSTSLSDLQIGEKVGALIDELNLTDRADSYIGGDAFFRGLSGGEKRRVSIGEQFIQEPRILVLDEPTSGLDSETTMLLLRLLKRYVSEEKGRTVIMSVHQPNSEVMAMIDRLCLMAHGRVVFDGPTTSAKSFFTSNGFEIPKNFNATDHYLSVITKRDSATALTQSFTSLRRAATNEEEHKSISHTQFPPHATMMAGTQFKESLGPGASWCAQFRCILIRNARQWWRDPVMLFAETLEYVGSGILIGMLFYRLPDTKYSGTLNRTSLFGFLLLILSFVPAFTTITKFDRQRGLLKREPTSGLYTFSAYYAAMTVMSWVVGLSLSFICGGLACFMPGLRTDVFGRYISVIMLYTPLSETIGLLSALVAKDATIGQLIHTPIATLFFMLGNFLSDKRSDTLMWVEWINPFYYSMVALIENEFWGLELKTSDIRYLGHGDDTNAFINECGIRVYNDTSVRIVKGEDVVRDNLKNGLDYSLNVIILFAMLVSLRLLGYYLLSTLYDETRANELVDSSHFATEPSGDEHPKPREFHTPIKAIELKVSSLRIDVKGDSSEGGGVSSGKENSQSEEDGVVCRPDFKQFPKGDCIRHSPSLEKFPKIDFKTHAV